jgi:N-acetyl-anhydromuramyl-L-alanine amidase AmpD
MEIANGGNDDPFPAVQIDACFDASNAINAHLGNLATDVAGHVDYAPDRKIDPNNCASVQGPWRPASNGTSANSWRLADLRAEANRRANQGDDDVTKDDIAAIADAVWRQMMTYRPTNKAMTAQELLEWVAQYATNADMQTRPPT